MMDNIIGTIDADKRQPRINPRIHTYKGRWKACTSSKYYLSKSVGPGLNPTKMTPTLILTKCLIHTRVLPL